MAVYEYRGGQDEEGEKIEEIVDWSESDELKAVSVRRMSVLSSVFQAINGLQMEDQERAWTLIAEGKNGGTNCIICNL